MIADIRLAISFKDHRKRRRLRMLLGDRATDYLLDLWISTAINHPLGYLTGMDALDIAMDAGFEGDPDMFVNALIKAGFLEYSEEYKCFYLHDWEEHQAYVIQQPARKAHATKAANVRWGGAKKAKHGDAQSMPGAQKTNARSMPGACPEQCGEHAPGMPGACPEHKKSMHGACPEHARSNAVSMPPECPEQCGEHAPGMPGACPEHRDAQSMPGAQEINARSMPGACPEHQKPMLGAMPSSLPKTEIHGDKDLDPPNTVLDTKIACAREEREGEEKDKGGGEVSGGAKSYLPANEEKLSPDFLSLRKLWDMNCKIEGPITGLNEFNLLKNKGIWPGIEKITADIDEKVKARVWNQGYAPSLKSYLRERWWESRKPDDARFKSEVTHDLELGDVARANKSVAQKVIAQFAAAGGAE